MKLQSDHKALAFVGAVAVLGAGVRVVRATSSEPRPGEQPALERQMQATDSAVHAQHADAQGRGRGRRSARSGGHGATHSKHDSSSGPNAPMVAADPRQHISPSALLDRRGYIGGKLDLDAATGSQIASLPGVTPRMAKRIVADRMNRGPFVSAQGLRRVPGVGPTLLRRIDSLITFTGTRVPPDPRDTIVARRRNARVKTAKPP